MSPTSQTFLAAIDLTAAEPARADDAFTAVTQYVPWPKSYGGDLVAQAVASASRTVSDDRVIHSTHSYFLRPADIGATIRYEVDRLRDGRSYSTREVKGYQGDTLVYAALASFHVREDGGGYAPIAPRDLPDPESLPSSAEALAGIPGPAAEYWSTGRSFDMRHIPAPIYLTASADAAPHQAIWIRSFDDLGDDPQLHRLALAYVCDYTILEPVLRQQGRAWSDPGLVTASLDHSLWFHRDGRLDEWVLYAQDAASAQDGRGLATGSFYSRSGELLATVAQEGMIRAPQGRNDSCA